jgi:hypothetical protein
LPFLTIGTFVQPELRTYGVNAWRFCVNSLPERSNLDHLRKQAKDLLRQYRARDPAALAAVRQHLPAAKDKSDAELSTMLLQLRDAQSCIARQYGFPSWHELKHYVQLKSDAQTPTSTEAEIAQRRYEIAQRAYEHARPRTAVPFDPKSFDKYVGYYQLSRRPDTFTHIFREGERFLEQLNTERRVGVTPVEFYPESETKFFATIVASQISFVTDAQGQVTGLVFHQGGHESAATRVDKSVVDTYEAALDQRIKENTASLGTEAFLCRYIVGCEKGQPNYDEMSPPLVRGVRRRQSLIENRHQRVGVFKALCFRGVDRRGWDVYEATFTQGQVEYRIPPLTADGKAADIAPREVP